MTRWFPLLQGWTFVREGTAPSMADLPHLPWLAGLNGENHWFGIARYRRTLPADLLSSNRGGFTFLHIGAAMQRVIVRVDGREIATHRGGYLPMVVDLTSATADGRSHELELEVDNRDAPDIPPGRAHATLDFCRYGGLYRDIHLRFAPPVYITDPIAANEIAGGGTFVRTLAADEKRATLLVRVHVANRSPNPREIVTSATLEHTGRQVARGTASLHLGSSAAQHVEIPLTVECPALWHPASPALHDLRIEVRDMGGSLLDAAAVRTGIRRIAFSRSGGFTINGRRWRPRGANRHQEYPFVGNAAPRTEQVRDAIRLKEAGFDYVRLSHYPQSPHFLDACDELGIVVMNCIPGWQFMGNDVFADACCEFARQLIRRDRNHPCVVLWELALNETAMPEDFMARLHAIGHEEFPGDQMFTCGWIDRYDVYLHSRQHGETHTWRNGDKALVIAEYGDWEFYAANAGFDQGAGRELLADWSNSRKFRADGERGLLQQAANHALALSDNLSTAAVADGQWAMFDYARGYHPLRAAVGVMDIFRLPKFSYYFYRSQRDAHENGTAWRGGPMVFIASHWLPTSSRTTSVFSNCDTVELLVDGVSLGEQKPSFTAATQHLRHPPFVFFVDANPPGELVAIGRIGGVEQARHVVRTPRNPSHLTLEIDDLGVRAGADEMDLLLVRASICDDAGTLCVEHTDTVTFAVSGEAELVGPAEVAAEAGIASAIVRLPRGNRPFSIGSSCGAWGTIPPLAARGTSSQGAGFVHLGCDLLNLDR